MGMIKIKKSLRMYVPLLLIFAMVSFAEAAEPMDIKGAIERVLKQNASLLSLRQEAAKAAAFKIQADGTLTPELGVSAYQDIQRENQTTDGSNRTDGRTAKIALVQTIYSGGRNSALRRQSAQVKSIADLSLLDGENKVVGELFARFYNVLLQEKRVETERSAIKTSELHLREITKMGELGLANRLEVIRADQQLAKNRADLSTAQGLYESSVLSLMNYMAIAPEDRRRVSGKIQVIDVKGGREDSLALAMQNRADKSIIEQQLAYQKNQVEIERSGMRPKVSLGAAASYQDPYRGRDNGSDTWRAELSITVPILDRGVTQSNVMRVGAVIEQYRIALDQKLLDVKSGVETAWTEIETTLEHIKSTKRALELAEETLRLAEIGFQEGVTPQLDLLSAQTSLTEARLEHQRSLYNHTLAVVALKVTEGNIISWTEEMDF